MIEKLKQEENEIIKTISNIKNNKNPLNVFFVISDLKNLFWKIWDSLLNWLNIEYSKNFEAIYQNILEKYKWVETFEETYAYYINTHSLWYFKNQIDNYFENSFFIDLSFFYYTLSFDQTYKILFSTLQTFYLNEKIRQDFYKIDTISKQIEFIKSFNPDIENLAFEKNKQIIVTFLNEISLIDLNEIKVSREINDELFVIDLMKNLTIYIFENKENFPDCYSFVISQFVDNKYLSNEIINNFEENKILKVISFLRNDLLSVINSDRVLNYSTKKELNKFLWEYKTYEMLSVEEKVDSYVRRQNFLKTFWDPIKSNFIRLYLKRKFLEENYTNIINLSIWVLFLPQEIFYQYKLNLKQTDISELSLYNQIKELILYIEDSYFLSFFRPFLLHRLSYFFNNSSQKYYIIKFMLLIILANSYTEYEKLQRFFYNLEIFFKDDIISFLKKCLIFWWVAILFFIIYSVAPFWVLLAMMIIIFKEIFLKIVWKFNPSLKLTLNFQMSTLASILAITSLILWTTIWLDVNSKLMYSKFRATINALTLNSAESTKILSNTFSQVKSDILWSNQKISTWSWFWDIDLYKTWDVTKAVKKLNPLNQITDVINKINPTANDEFNFKEAAINQLLEENTIQEDNSDYSYVVINKNHTFWDYAKEIAIKNWIDIHSKDFEKKISNSLEIFLTENKSKLLKYIPNQNLRLWIWDIPRYLPEIYFDLSWLERIIRENK